MASPLERGCHHSRIAGSKIAPITIWCFIKNGKLVYNYTILCLLRYRVRQGNKAVCPTVAVMFFVIACVFNEPLSDPDGLDSEGYLVTCQSHGEPAKINQFDLFSLHLPLIM